MGIDRDAKEDMTLEFSKWCRKFLWEEETVPEERRFKAVREGEEEMVKEKENACPH